MTDLLLPEDTDETRVIVYPQPYLSAIDTAVIEPPYLWADAIQARRPAADAWITTGELPIWPTGAELAVAGRPTGPPPSRPDDYRGKRRAADPSWAWALIGAGTLLLAQAVGAGLAVLAVTW